MGQVSLSDRPYIGYWSKRAIRLLGKYWYYWLRDKTIFTIESLVGPVSSHPFKVPPYCLKADRKYKMINFLFRVTFSEIKHLKNVRKQVLINKPRSTRFWNILTVKCYYIKQSLISIIIVLFVGMKGANFVFLLFTVNNNKNAKCKQTKSANVYNRVHEHVNLATKSLDC